MRRSLLGGRARDYKSRARMDWERLAERRGSRRSAWTEARFVEVWSSWMLTNGTMLSSRRSCFHSCGLPWSETTYPRLGGQASRRARFARFGMTTRRKRKRTSSKFTSAQRFPPGALAGACRKGNFGYYNRVTRAGRLASGLGENAWKKR